MHPIENYTKTDLGKTYLTMPLPKKMTLTKATRHPGSVNELRINAKKKESLLKIQDDAVSERLSRIKKN